VRGAGWNPATVGLTSESAPGLAVAPDLEAWSRPGSSTPGVFAGASRSLGSDAGRVVAPGHPGCDRGPDRQYRSGPWLGQVRRWTNCQGTTVSFTEVVLTHPDGYGVYVQVKQVDQHDRTDDILASLRVRSP
ncbi:MAG TPA: hypothetical protein VGR21_02145, partial [Cryptosporangiaceae bacterium]|nr:hypothetical protein [Cryptosporangiaceae bacterium]